MELFFVWFIFAVIVAVGAGSRGRSGLGWFVLAMIISPLLAVILLFLVPVVKPADVSVPTSESHVKCPDCAELVLAEARKCKHCGCRLVPRSEQPTPEPLVVAAPDTSFLDRRGRN